MPDLAPTEAEIIALGKKLDQFSEVLTPNEQLLMYAMIRAAAKQFLSLSNPKATTPAPAPPQQTLPKLGNAFDAAFIPGKASQFQDQTEFSIGPIKISGSVTAGVE